MTRRPLALALLACLVAGCSEGAGDQLPGGTFAGSTATDRPFTLEVSEEPKVNRNDARFVDRGVLESEKGGVRTTLTCKVTDPDGEELRCTVVTTAPAGASTTEVIDLMLL